jgi:thymidine phosphorylase
MQAARDIIEKKRDGGVLQAPELRDLISGISRNEVTDAQIAAFAMAVWFRGMTPEEVMTLTCAMRDSGEVLSWPELDGPVLDKHSTGGVGDMVSLILGPIVAACGGYVPMISGRGLGHTGGTLDKLESIAGFQTQPSVERFRAVVREAGVAIVGQTAELVPADRRLYAVRDETSTVASLPLIISSILSKKLAEGLDGLVLDIKSGNGAFMPTLDAARELAGDIAQVSRSAGLPCRALVTDMNQPLAWSAGNALEIDESIRFLSGQARHSRLDEVVRKLSAELVLLGGLAHDLQAALQQVDEVLESGAAIEAFARMVSLQGGPADLVEQPARYLAGAPVRRPVFVERQGYLAKVNTREIGMVVVRLGGGRKTAQDPVDHSVGLSGLSRLGDWLDLSQPLATVHARSEADYREAEAALRAAVQLSEERVDSGPAVIACYGGRDG